MSRVKSKGRVSRPKQLHPPPLDVRRALASFDTIEVVSPEFREMVADQAPELLGRLPPRKPPARSARRRKS